MQLLLRHKELAVATASRKKGVVNTWNDPYLSVIRQKGEYQNGCFKKAKHAKISEKQIFLTFGVLCFLETPVLRFALLPYSR